MLFKIYFFIVFYCVLVLGFKDFQSNRFYYLKIESKLPIKYDLKEYLEALNRIIHFSGKHANELDINVYFGLFLVNVNFKRALQDKLVLPQKLDTYVKEIIQNTENILEKFKEQFENDYDLHNKKNKSMLSLIVNTKNWIIRLPKFVSYRLNETESYLKKFNRNWIMYRVNVDDRNWVPNPHQSDTCLRSLASAEAVQIGSYRLCKVLKSCHEMVKNGTDFGYALAHRLLFLQQARFSRACSIFSDEEDREMRRRFCSAAYKEVQYIAEHHFEIVDLFLEHVCLCALEGYVQFLDQSWMSKILSFQTEYGCFTPSQSVCILRPGDDLHGCCNGHTTAVAAGTLAIASRFILQFYY